MPQVHISRDCRSSGQDHHSRGTYDVRRAQKTRREAKTSAGDSLQTDEERGRIHIRAVKQGAGRPVRKRAEDPRKMPEHEQL